MPTKLCPHTLTAHGDLRSYVQAGSPVVKLVDDFGPAAELQALNPRLVILGRVYEAYDPNADARSGKAAVQAARELIDRQREKYRLNPAIKIWEGPNEPVFGNADDPANVKAMEWYGAFEAERLRLLADLGLRGVIGNFATGTPDLALWPVFLAAVEAADHYQGFLGVHEYGAPWMWWLTGTYQPTNCDGQANIPGEGDTGWLTLRYRKVYRNYLTPNGLGHIPLIMTECGLDHVGGLCPGMSSGPWKKHFDFWRSQDGARDPIDYWRGPERDVERYYAEQLMWYDRELQKDPFVVGATLFTVGYSNPQWELFDLGGSRVAQYLFDYMRQQPAAAPAASATPPATPPREHTVPPSSDARRGPPPPNLLMNASFEEGKAYYSDETRERAVPAGWMFSYAEPATPLEARQTAPWGRPITALINRQAVALADQTRVFAGGQYCWKIAGTAAPVWVRLTQSLFGLQAGQKYIFVVNLLPDVIVRTHPQLAYASDPLASEVKLAAGFAEKTFDSGWLALPATPAGKYTRLALTFTASSSRAEIVLEVRGRWALPQGAWYVDELSVSPAA